ncbi:MAG: TolC family protein [Chitinophagaceae bacterium]
MNSIYMVAAATLMATQLTAQTVNQFSVGQAVDYASKNNVQVKNAILNLRVQEQINRGITSAALPNVTGSLNVTDNLKIATQLLPGEFFGQPAGTFIPVKFGTKYTANSGLNLNQLLFDGQVFIGLKARKTSLDFQQKNIEVTEEMIKKNIYKIYYQLVVSKTQITLLDANIERLGKLDHDTREIYKNGFAEKLDVNKIEVQMTNLQTQKLKALSAIDNGYLGLKVLMGMPVKDSLVLTDSITDASLKDALLDDGKYDYKNRKDFQYLDLAKSLREFNIRRYKLSYLPTLSFNANTSYSAQRSSFDFFKKSGTWFPSTYIAFKLNVPIFDGFAKAASLQQARYELQQTQNTLDNLQLSIDSDVQQALTSYRTAIATIDYQKKNMTLAGEVYNQTKKKYEIGTGSNTEITAAQTELVQAQTNYISALYDAVIARVDYMAAIGKL